MLVAHLFGITKKRCRKCLQVKALTEFSPSNCGHRLGVASQCKKCMRERARRFRAEHRLKIFLNNKRLIAKTQDRRRRVIALLGNKCVYCGCVWYECLDIHHKNLDGEKDLSRRNKYTFYQRILDGERSTDDLALACKKCHRCFHPLTPRTRVARVDGIPCRLCGSRDTVKDGFSNIRLDGTRGQRIKCMTCGRSLLGDA